MSNSITLSIPVRDGTTETVQAIQATPHFAVHKAVDVVVWRDLDTEPWSITHIPSLCCVIYSDTQEHAETCAMALEALDIDWDIPCPVDVNRDVKAKIIGACRCLASVSCSVTKPAHPAARSYWVDAAKCHRISNPMSRKNWTS